MALSAIPWTIIPLYFWDGGVASVSIATPCQHDRMHKQMFSRSNKEALCWNLTASLPIIWIFPVLNNETCVEMSRKGPSNTGLYRQVVLIEWLVSILTLVYGSAHSGLCRQVVIVNGTGSITDQHVDQPIVSSIDRWPLCTGGPCVQVVLVYRWFLYTGGPCVQVALVYRWPLCTGGPCVQVALVYRWSFYTGGPSIQVVLLYRWPLCTGGPCVQVVLLYRWSFCTCGPCVQVVLLYR